MIKIYIAGTDRSSNLIKNTVSISENLDNATDTCSFNLYNHKPTAGQEIIVYSGNILDADVTSGASKNITLYYDITAGFNQWEHYRVGDTVIVGIEDADEEEATVTGIGSNYVTCTLANNHSKGDMLGIKVFAGTIDKVSMSEITGNTSQVDYSVSCVDYVKKFDRKLVNRVYIDRTIEYIIIDILNRYVNYNQLIDDFEYANAGALQAIWADSNDADNPTRETSDFKEGDTAAVFPWTNALGFATFDGNLSGTPFDISDFTGAASGAPSDGVFLFWMKAADYTTITDIDIYLGSTFATDNVDFTITVSDNDWHYIALKLTDGNVNGTPDWTAFDSIRFQVNETASSNITVDGMRFVKENDYFTFDNVEATTPTIDDVRFVFKEPSIVIQRLAEMVGWHWYIDYDKDVHFFEEHDKNAPFNLTDTNLYAGNISVTPDIQQLVNVIYVRGSSEPSATQTEILVADGSQTTFPIAQPPRTIGYDDDVEQPIYDYTLEIDPGGGYASKTVGILHRQDSTSYEWMLNAETANGYIVPGTDATPSVGDLIKHTYTYEKPILVRLQNGASIAAMKGLIGGDGIIEHAVTNNSIKSSDQATQYAQSYLDKYSNAIVDLDFTTNYNGLAAGQLILFTNSNFGYTTEQFLIQRVDKDIDGDNELFTYKVLASTTLFGLDQLFKLLLDEDLEINEGQTIEDIESAYEGVNITDSGVADLTAASWTYGPDAGEGRYNLAEYA